MIAESWTDPTYAEIASWIHARTGLTLSPYRYPDAELKIRRVMAKAGARELENCRRMLEGERMPLDELVAELTVGETYFFRDPAQFQYIRTELLPQLRKRHGSDHPIRAWSAGCASGEEAYSLAILFEEEAVDGGASILATDISRPALTRARQALYGSWSMRGDDGRLARRYFRPRGAQLHLEDRIRRRVDFQYLNLALDRYPSLASGAWGMDIVLCRNVLIYFDHATVRRVIRSLIESLAEGGVLITGASDPVYQEDGPYEVLVTPAGVFYRRTSGAGFATRSVAGPTPAPRPVEARRPAVAAAAQPAPAPVARRIEPAPERDMAALADQAAAAGDHRAVLRLTEGRIQDPETMLLRLKALANLGELARAELESAKLVAASPLVPSLHFTRAMLLMALDRHEDAERSLLSTLYLDRSLVAAYLALGHLLLRRGDSTGAQRAYRVGRDLAAMQRPDELLPLAEGETAGRMVAAAETQLAMLLAPTGELA